ncbi:MAG: polyprenol phosphomannose-dependent alpha 1,6 mannosyltransferase MptB [Acidimicrobiales bacterium]
MLTGAVALATWVAAERQAVILGKRSEVLTSPATSFATTPSSGGDGALRSNVGVPTPLHGTRLARAAASTVPWIAMGTAGVVAMALIGTRVGAVPRPASVQWWFHLPGGVSPTAKLGFYFGVAILVAGWAGLGRVARAGGLSVRRGWLILALWGLPLLLAPPLFSRDIYSYIGQGLLAHHGFNPYSVSPSALGAGPLLASIARVWRHTASPYGPLFVGATQLGAAVSGGSLVVQVLVFRLLELVGVLLVMVSLPRLARHLGTDPGIALWLGALSPLALFSFVASGHNDALMVGIMLVGVTIALEGRLAVGLALCALAATIKLPAAAAVVFIGFDRLRSAGDAAGRWRVIRDAVAAPALVVAVVTAAAGWRWSWLGPSALRVPTELRVLITPSVALGTFFHGAVHLVGIPLGLSATVTATQWICTLTAAGGSLWLVLNTRRIGVVTALGLALGLVAVLSPTLWPWYLMWGLALLAATAAQRSVALALVAGLAMLLVGPGGVPMLGGVSYWVTGPLLLLGLAWFVRDRHGRVLMATSPEVVSRGG